MHPVQLYRHLSVLSLFLVLGCAGKAPPADGETPTASVTPAKTAVAPAVTEPALYLWSDGFLYRYEVASGVSEPVSDVLYDGYAFDRARGLIWLYDSLHVEGVPTTVQIEVLETTGDSESVLFAEGISPDFTGVGIDRKVYVYGGDIMSEGYCYEDRLTASPCNMALFWGEPHMLELKKEDGGWQTASGSVLGGEWLDSRSDVPEETSTIGAQSEGAASIQPLPLAMVGQECECWGEEGACGSAVALQKGSLQLVTIGLGCGDMMYQSCGIYDSTAKGYYSFSEEESDGSDSESFIGTLHPLESEDLDGIGTSCALLEAADGSWFVTAEGMLCKPGEDGELRCRNLDGHIAGWTPGIHKLLPAY